MRFKLTLKVNKHKFGNTIPLNYQYEQSAVVYRILTDSSDLYDNWLYENSYKQENRYFKLFTYSRFFVPKYRISSEDARLLILCDNIDWYISFLPDYKTVDFVHNLFFNKVFQLGDKKSRVEFTVVQIDVLPSINYDCNAIFETISPMCITKRELNGKTTYLPPTDSYASQSIFTSLKTRYQIFYNKEYCGSEDFHLEILNEPKSVLIKIKSDTPQETNVRGFMCRFKIKADPELMKIMYECGIGMKGSQGWGMVKLKKLLSS